MYYLRLDDASEYMNISNWKRMEHLLDQYSIMPIFGIIPDNKDEELVTYGKVDDFWQLAHSWIKKGWIPALHGYSHVYTTKNGGINPINKKSEFAGVDLEIQKEKIVKGIEILNNHKISPKVFFAPAHTFDQNTKIALRECSDINIISDTVACDIYYDGYFYFIPQQSGKVRFLPFRTVTYCYHPNTMTETDFITLEVFLKSHYQKFAQLDCCQLTKRKLGLLDRFIRFLYFVRRAGK